MIVGFAGYATAGKDTAAQALIEQRSYTKRGFADALRRSVYVLNPIVSCPSYTTVAPMTYQQAVDKYGYDEAKAVYPEVRALLQRMGTEVGRQTFWDDFWVDLLKKQLMEDADDYVITDVRFVNEAECVRSLGGVLVWVNRPGTGPLNDHPSETSLDDYQFDFCIDNDGSIDQLHDRVLELFG